MFVEYDGMQKNMATTTLFGAMWEFPKIRGTFLGVHTIRRLWSILRSPY